MQLPKVRGPLAVTKFTLDVCLLITGEFVCSSVGCSLASQSTMDHMQVDTSAFDDEDY